MMANKTSKWESSLSNGVRGVAFIDFNCGKNVYKTSQSAIAPAKMVKIELWYGLGNFWIKKKYTCYYMLTMLAFVFLSIWSWISIEGLEKCKI